jgi:predicted transcriptional regulator
MARPPSTQPTDGELEILKILWESGPAGLGQIHGTLASGRPVAVTTVATMLKMMLAKELVKRHPGPRGFLWSARVSRQAAVSGLLAKLLEHVFDGSARRLVAHLIEEGDLDDRERGEILELLKLRANSAGKPASRKKGADE